ncbi:ketopantoate reductase family protein [Thermoactinomyces mirandus]|uniref:2-dehydropantoate 2-reductase n=1 Tax=Thermoactinomyces mirandus TaxID=2756294 RepID=A0A7W2ARF3_9BACL|nr:ketopantoate reductase family protein [Thermoactinomyces mirandus]MBA4602929.1 ketopantoate reductase family protein [Thermoactinomyces mirandus]
MRVLVVGAGAMGGYFGGRLVEKGEDVTFLVRPGRQQQLKKTGLVIKSVHGNFRSPVKTLISGEPCEPFDLVLLAVKAYHLNGAIPSFEPYVHEHTMILPLLNGIRHMETLWQHFPEKNVLGGLGFIETTLNRQGEIEQYSAVHDVVFGEWDGTETPRIKQVEKLFQGARMGSRSSLKIQLEMWKKYLFISAMSGMTCLMRSSIGPILSSPYGKETYKSFLDELFSVAVQKEPRLSPDLPEKILTNTARLEPTMKSSMLRDLEKGLPIETDHFHGTLIEWAQKEQKLPILKAIYSTLSIYQEQQKNSYNEK